MGCTVDRVVAIVARILVGLICLFPDRGAIEVRHGYFALALDDAATRSLAVPTGDPGVWWIDLEHAAVAEVIEATRCAALSAGRPIEGGRVVRFRAARRPAPATKEIAP